MSELTEFEHGIIIRRWLFGHTEQEIEAITGHPKSTVHDTIERYSETGAGSSRPRSGRPPILTDWDKHHIVRIVKSNQQDNSRATLSSHLELLLALKQLRELCMKLATIVELLSESHSFQQKLTRLFTMV